MNKLTRLEVYDIIDSEIIYANLKWDKNVTISENKHATFEEWFMYIEDYINEAKHILSRKPKQIADKEASDIMRKVAALSIRAIEQLGASKRNIPENFIYE